MKLNDITEAQSAAALTYQKHVKDKQTVDYLQRQSPLCSRYNEHGKLPETCRTGCGHVKPLNICPWDGRGEGSCSCFD